MSRVTTYLGYAFGVAALAAIAFGAYAYHPAIAPVPTPEKSAFAPEVVAKGKLLAAAGYCAECHTAAGGPPYAGNYPLATGFGTIYGSNLTPDAETGIGAWSLAAFRRAMHDGVRRDGWQLFPAFPFDHFTKMSDEDVDAVYAYLMSEVAPVKQATKESTLPFPLNLRFLQAGWQLLFVDFGRYQPDTTKSAEWNRGAYLAEGVAHCGACHTPRNLLGAEKTSEQYAGAQIDNWTAPALTSANPSAVPWSADDFARYLETGAGVYHGIAAGPMGPVVHEGIRKLPDQDIRAIAAYLGSITNAPDANPADNPLVQASLKENQPDPTYRKNEGERLYASACAACHYNATEVLPGRPDLAINSSTRLDTPDNLLHVILDGVDSHNGTAGIVMPAFRNALSDEQIASIAAYLREARADLPPWQDLTAKVSDLRRAGAED